MHLLAVPAAGYALFCILSIYHAQFLRHYCRHTHIALELSDYQHERAGLLAGSGAARSSNYRKDGPPLPSSSTSDQSADEGDKNASVSSISSTESTNDLYNSQIDEYTMHTVQPIQVFYSDYQKMTQRWIIVELIVTLLLFACSIWYLIASYRVPGGLLLAVMIVELIRLVMVLRVTNSRGPILGFKILMGLTALTKIGLLALSIFLCVQVFTLSSHVSAYFTTALLGPSFFIGSVTTIRMWKMFEVVYEKNAKMHF